MNPFQDLEPHTAEIDINTIEIEFHLNGVATRLSIDPSERLLDTLRYRLALPGTKEGCGEGECGACTVYLDGLPVNACLVPTYQIRGTRLDTVESLPTARLAELHASGATQCGACTPGVAMTACWICDHPDLLERYSLRELMAGNLCRCTGYDGIIDGIARTLAGAVSTRPEDEAERRCRS